MSVEHVKSPGITNSDAVPVVANTAGVEAAGELKVVSGHAVTIAASSQNSTYQLVRLPSTAKVKLIIFESAAQAAGTVDLGVYRTDLEILAANAVDQDLFASDIAVTSLVAPTIVTNEAGTYTIDEQCKPLWEAAGLSVDPKVPLDIVATIDTAITTGAARLGVHVFYTN